jgi:hypothetical protein
VANDTQALAADSSTRAGSIKSIHSIDLFEEIHWTESPLRRIAAPH